MIWSEIEKKSNTSIFKFINIIDRYVFFNSRYRKLYNGDQDINLTKLQMFVNFLLINLLQASALTFGNNHSVSLSLLMWKVFVYQKYTFNINIFIIQILYMTLSFSDNLANLLLTICLKITSAVCPLICFSV